MLGEVKKFFENLTHFRQLLKEGVSENVVVDAIQKHKIVYIYYAGDNTIMKGYRTIKPMVLGYTKSNEAKKRGENYMLLRAWEVAGNSDSQKKYPDEKGRMQYGWRLFRVDKITSFLPTGKIFSTEEGKFPDIESYNPNDSQMQNIVAAVELVGDKAKTTKRGAYVAPRVSQPSAFDGQKEKFQYFSKAGKRQRNATADEIEHLWAIASKIRKKSPSDMIVVVDEHGDMVLKDAALKDKFPPESYVGNLKQLYLDLVKPNLKIDRSKLDIERKKAINQMNKSNIKQNEIKRKTFFK